MAFRTVKLSDEQFQAFRDLIYSLSGIFFPEHKKYLLESRLGKRLKALNIDSFKEYIMYVKYKDIKKEELSQIYNSITINETFFFRYNKQLLVFKEKLLPQVMQDKKFGNVNIWSAASSSGEELYTIGMILRESQGTNLSRFKVLGTDISEKVLEKAREGVYSANSFRGAMTPVQKRDNFDPKGTGFQIKPELKRLIKFEYFNLNDQSAFWKKRGQDFIFCRNVLIYFDDTIKKKVLQNLYDVMNHGGYLFLGEAESIHGVSSSFKALHYPGVIVYKKE